MILLSLLLACGDKADDTGSAGDTSATETDTSAELGAAPAAGVVVAELTSGGFSTTLICTDAGYGLRTEDTIVFNTLNHSEACSTSGSSGYLALINLPVVSLSSYPGGIAEVEMEVESIVYRVYGSDASSFQTEVTRYDYATGEFVGTLWLKWPDAELKVWIDGKIGA